MNISQILSDHARYRPDHLAFVFEESRMSYAQLNKEVNRLAHALLGENLKKGDKVATLLSNTPELWETYWACAKIGAVVVPLSPLLRDEGLVNLLNQSDTSILITQASMIAHLDLVRAQLHLKDKNIWVTDERITPYRSLQERKSKSSDQNPVISDIQDDDLYNIIYSSGTTGQPKGIMLSHRVRALYMTLLSNTFRITPESIVMHSGSIIFNGSYLTTMPVMYMGATFLLMPGFETIKVLQSLQKEKVTHTILVPSQIIQMLDCDDFTREHLPALQMILTVGAPLDKSYKLELEKRIPGVFYELYGLTEGFVTILDKTEATRKMGSVGKPPPFFEMKIVDDKDVQLPPGEIGEIVGKGPFLMEGYYKDPVRTSESIRDRWLYTGDLGYVDSEGFLYIAGRKKDLIISGGVNVYPSDIESIVLGHPDVIEVAVIGVPHVKWGETPVAAIVSRTRDANKQELKEWINERLHVRSQKIDDVIMMQELPRNVAGKVLKNTIRTQYLSQ